MKIIKEYAWAAISIVYAIAIMAFCGVFSGPEEVAAVSNQYDVPQEVAEAAEKYGAEYGICPEFLEAIAYYESSYRPQVSNKSGTCHGLMQVSYSAHADRMKKLGVSNLHDLDQNMKVAAHYLRELFEEYEDPGMVLMVYNGDGRAEQYFEQGILSEYAWNIIHMAEDLEELHGKKDFVPSAEGVG